MPTADGRFLGIGVPELPWRQRFEPGDRVRVANTGTTGRYAGQHGTVDCVRCDGFGDWVWVRLDERGASPATLFDPGELRRVDA